MKDCSVVKKFLSTIYKYFFDTKQILGGNFFLGSKILEMGEWRMENGKCRMENGCFIFHSAKAGISIARHSCAITCAAIDLLRNYVF